MASLALNIVGGLLAPFTGGASVFVTAGLTFAGAVLDSQFIFPAIFGKPQTSQHLDLNLQMASEGSPMNSCLGPENRIAGTVIWMTQLKENKVKQHSGKGFGGGSTSYTYSVSCAVGVCEGPITTIKKIWADTKLIYDADNGGQGKRTNSITIYPGNGTQTGDPVIQSYEGSANTPAFRHTAYVVFEDLQLADFGNRLPQFSFLVEQAKTLSVGTGIATVLQRAGLTTDQYDVSSLVGCIRGYAWAGPQPAQQTLTQILNTYFVRVQEVSGKLVFFPRGSEAEVAVLESDLAASDSDTIIDQLKITDAEGLSLPSEVVVNYLDPIRAYQQGSQSYKRQFAPSTSTMVQDVPLVLDAADAQALAQRTLWSVWGERQAGEFSLPVSYLELQEGDVAVVPFKGNSYKIRCLEIDRGANFLLQIKGVVQDSDTVNTVATQDAFSEDPLPTLGDPPVAFVAVDLPALRTDDVAAPGLYLAAADRNSADAWAGAAVVSSATADGVFSSAEALAGEGVIGYAITALADGPTEYWDYVNTVDVQLYGKGALDTVTADEALAGANFLLLGSEIICFQTAMLLDIGKYRLSGLLRGRRNTELATTLHTSGETVLLLSPEALGRQVLSLSALNATRFYKAVPTGASVDSYTARPAVAVGHNLKPFSPCNIQVADVSGDLVITWSRRSRDVVNILGSVPNLDLDEYVVELLSFGAVFRTLTCSSAKTVTWTAAQQASDAVASSTVEIRVYQLSAVVGRGNPGITTITV